MRISAYIPCYNGAATLRFAIEGMKTQERPVDELFVVDNGSADDSARVAEKAGVRVVRLDRCLGRGAARARAMAEARHPLVVSCDSAIVLPPDFVAKAVALVRGCVGRGGRRADSPEGSADRGGSMAGTALIPYRQANGSDRAGRFFDRGGDGQGLGGGGRGRIRRKMLPRGGCGPGSAVARTRVQGNLRPRTDLLADRLE